MNRFCKAFFGVFFAVLIVLMVYLTCGLIDSIQTLSCSGHGVYAAALAQTVPMA